MIRSALGKVAWVGRTASMVFGLALVLALVLGAATTALSATGGNFILGQPNSADAPTTLTWTGNTDITKAALVLKNIKGGFPLQLQAGNGIAPMKVNSATKVAKLNADKVDGHDAPLWAVVDFSGNISRANGVTSVRKVGTGQYVVYFNRTVSQCAFSATLSQGGHVHVNTAGDSDSGVFVNTKDYSGTDTNSGFHLIVNC